MSLSPELAQAVVDAPAAALAPQEDTDLWVDSRQAPLPQRHIRDAVRRGEIEGHRIARRLLVRRSALDAYIQAHRVHPAPRVEADVPAAIVQLGGIRRRTG